MAKMYGAADFSATQNAHVCIMDAHVCILSGFVSKSACIPGILIKS